MERAHARLLRDVLRVVIVAREPAREVVGGIQMRHDEAFKLGRLFVVAHLPSIEVQTRGTEFYSRRNNFPAASPGQCKSKQKSHKNNMKTKTKFIQHDPNNRWPRPARLLKCMAWAGTGMLWNVNGGLLGSALLAGPRRRGGPGQRQFQLLCRSATRTLASQGSINTDVVATAQAGHRAHQRAAATARFHFYTRGI